MPGEDAECAGIDARKNSGGSPAARGWTEWVIIPGRLVGVAVILFGVANIAQTDFWFHARNSSQFLHLLAALSIGIGQGVLLLIGTEILGKMISR